MAEISALSKPGVRVFQELSDEQSAQRRPILQPAVIAQAFQLVGKVAGDSAGALAGVYVGDELADIDYPGLLSEAEVDNYSGTYDGEPDLLDEVIVEIEDANATFDVSDDDEVVISSAGVDIGKALTTYVQVLGPTIVTTQAGLKRLTFPSSVDLFALGVRANGAYYLRFATATADLVDPARSIPSSEVDPNTGLSQDYQIIGVPARNVIDVQILGEEWAGFDGETAVQAEIRLYPAGEGILIAPHEDGAGIDLPASDTFTIVNAGVNFLGSRPVQPGDVLRITTNQDDIVGDAAIIVDNVESIPTTLAPTTPATTLAGTTLASTTPVPAVEGSGVVGIDTPILAGNVFTDADANFVAAGVTANMYLRFIQDAADLDGSYGQVVTRNVKDVRITNVSATALTLATALISESPNTGKSFQYQVVLKNQPSANNTSDVKIIAVLGPQSVQLETALTAEARTLSREFEFSIIRQRVPNGNVRISYRALRGDLADTFTEVQADDTQGLTQLVTRLGPIASGQRNPLALMAALCAFQTTDSIGAVAVRHWTQEEVGKALDVLGAQPQVYGIAIGTQDETLNSLVIAHVNQFSDPDERLGLERYCALSYRFPFQDVVLATQTGSTALLQVQGDRTHVKIPSGASYDFSEVRPNHVLKLDPNGTGRTIGFNVGGAEIERDEVRIVAVIGTNELVLAEEIHSSEGSTVAGPWRIDTHVREKMELASIIANFNAAIGNRRVESVFPADVIANVDGGDETLPSYYYCAGSIGLRAAQAPGKPMTFAPTAGFSGVVGDVFSEEHYDIMAGGGTWIIYQAAPGAPLAARHQLTTDVASIIRQESSIRVALDFTAKKFRTELRPLIGRRNITERFIQQELRPRAEGILTSLIEEDVLDENSSIIKIERDPNKSDRVLFTVRAVTLKPYNEGDVILAVE